MPKTFKIEKNQIPLHDPIMWLWVCGDYYRCVDNKAHILYCPANKHMILASVTVEFLPILIIVYILQIIFIVVELYRQNMLAQRKRYSGSIFEKKADI